jgi:hypothetical protein
MYIFGGKRVQHGSSLFSVELELVGLGMTSEKLFHELLGLGLNWEVVESRFERESGTFF